METSTFEAVIESNLIQEKHYRNIKKCNGIILLESISDRTTWIELDLWSKEKQCIMWKDAIVFTLNKLIVSRSLQAISFPTEDKYWSTWYSSKKYDNV